MAPKELTLTLAAFLDSPASLALAAPDTEGQRHLAKAFLEACYLDAGLAPQHLDGDSIEAVLTQHFPARLAPRDPLAPHAPAVVAALLEHVQSRTTMPFAFEARMGLDRAEPAFRAAVADGSTPRRRQQETVQHTADKVGRNEPCWCGSGKKFKKCHGK